MKKGASSRKGKGRFHPSRISGHEKFARMREANKSKEQKKKDQWFENIRDLLK